MANYILNMGGTINDGSQDISAVDVFKITSSGVEHITDHGLSLSVARGYLAAASCGNYILAMGGDIGSGTRSNAVDVFQVTTNGIEAVPGHGLSLSEPRDFLAAASCGNYILAMGGDRGGSTRSNTVDVFKVTSSGIEHITDHGLSLSDPRGYLSAASCGNYILAMGGINSSVDSNAVDVFKVTDNGVEAVQDHGLSLSVARAHMATASCGNYILAMGGDDGAYTDAVDVFQVTTNGVEHITDHGLSLSVSRNTLSAASCGNYILAMGGYVSGTYSNAVDVFKVTANGVEHIVDHGLSLSVARCYLSSASAGNYILSLGGRNGGSTPVNAVDVFQVNN